MDNHNFKKSEQWLILIYKILHDILFLLLVFLAAAIVVEGIVPGFLSSRLSFAKIILPICTIVVAIFFVSQKINLPIFTFKKKKRNQLVAGCFLFVIVLVVNSLLKFALWENIFITLIAAVILFYFHKVFSDSPEN